MKPDHIPERIKNRMDELTEVLKLVEEAAENCSLEFHFAVAAYRIIGQLRQVVCEEWDMLARAQKGLFF